MKCKRILSRIPDLLSGDIGDDERAAIERHLAGCESCRSEYEQLAEVWNGLEGLPDEEPDPQLGERFHTMLAGFRTVGLPNIQEMPNGISSRRSRANMIFHVYIPQLAAAVLLVVAGFLAGRTGRPDPEIAKLHQEMTDLRNMVATSLVNQESAIKRLEGLAMASRVTDPDEAFLSLLVVTLNTDPNVNVRLAAIDALASFQSNKWVRGELVKSLAAQASPLVQVSLIELLVAMDEREAVGVLRAITENETTIDTVKKRAQWGIQQMI